MKLRVLSLCAVALTFPLVVHGKDAWPQFLGPAGDNQVETDLPVNWDRDSNIRWRSELPGSGWSSPVAAGGKIYLTAAVPVSDAEQSDLNLSLIGVDANSGEKEFVRTLLHQPAGEVAKIHSKNSHASPTPIVDGNQLYAHFGYFGTVCADLAGSVQWQSQELKFRPVHGGGGSPVLVGNQLIFTCDGASVAEVAALDKTTGEVVWRTPRPVDAKKKFSFCTPTLIEVDGQQQVIAPGSDCVLSLDPRDGRILWLVRYDGYSVVPKPVFHGGLVFLSTGYDDASLLAIDPSGSGDVTDSHVVWTLDRGGVPKSPSLLAQDGLLYLLSDDGILTCLDAKTGRRIYLERVGGNYSASPLLAGGRIYCVSEEGTTHVIQAGRRFRSLARNELGERTLASPAVLDDNLIIRTAKALYRIGSE